MTRDDHSPTPDALGDYWDALLAGQPSQADLEPAFRETIDRLHAHDDARSPRPIFVSRLERTLLESSPTIASPVWASLSATSSIVPDGREPASVSPAPWTRRLRRPWAATVATAALVLLTLVGSLAILRRSHPEAPDGRLVVQVMPGDIAETLLMRHVIDTVPEGPLWTKLEHIALGPASQMDQGTASTGGIGPALYRIDSGQISARAEGAMAVTRVGTTEQETISPATDVVLRTGDTAFVPSGVASRWWTNDAQSAAITFAGLDLGVIAPGNNSRVINGVDVPRWAKGSVLAHKLLMGGSELRLPAAPVELAVRRLVLAPGARLAETLAMIPTFIYVESGTLAVTKEVTLDPFARVDGIQIQAGSWTDPGNARYAGYVLGNDGAEPLVLLVMTVTSLATDAAAPPASVDPSRWRELRPRA